MSTFTMEHNGKWSSAGNWNLKKLPTLGDDVVFDSNSATKIDVDADVEISNFMTNTDFSGEILVANGVSFIVKNNFTLNAGHFTTNSGILKVENDLILSNNAVLNLNAGNWSVKNLNVSNSAKINKSKNTLTKFNGRIIMPLLDPSAAAAVLASCPCIIEMARQCCNCVCPPVPPPAAVSSLGRSGPPGDIMALGIINVFGLDYRKITPCGPGAVPDIMEVRFFGVKNKNEKNGYYCEQCEQFNTIFYLYRNPIDYNWMTFIGDNYTWATGSDNYYDPLEDFARSFPHTLFRGIELSMNEDEVLISISKGMLSSDAEFVGERLVKNNCYMPIKLNLLEQDNIPFQDQDGYFRLCDWTEATCEIIGFTIPFWVGRFSKKTFYKKDGKIVVNAKKLIHRLAMRRYGQRAISKYGLAKLASLLKAKRLS